MDVFRKGQGRETLIFWKELPNLMTESPLFW